MARSLDKRSLSYKLRREFVGKYQAHLLTKVRGIVHVGANVGQERARYAEHDLDVVWIEPIDDVFRRLCANLSGYPKQIACNYLVTDKTGASYTFHVASNDGSSSSILELADHKAIFPDIGYVRDFTITSVTLPELVARESIDMAKYDFLVLDTQGSELLVLEGAVPLLPHFRYVQVEAADFEAYKGCCKVADIEAFMLHHGFVETHRKRTSVHPAGGRYFEITYGREMPGLIERLMV